MPLAAMVAQEQVLAMRATLELIERVPECEPFLDGKERRVLYEVVWQPVALEEVHYAFCLVG